MRSAQRTKPQPQKVKEIAPKKITQKKSLAAKKTVRSTTKRTITKKSSSINTKSSNVLTSNHNIPGLSMNLTTRSTLRTKKNIQKSTTLGGVGSGGALTTSQRFMSFLPEERPQDPIPNYTPPVPITDPKGSFAWHKSAAERDGFKVGGHRRLTNVVRGSWTQRPVINYNIVHHLGREPEEVDQMQDGAKIMVEPSQFTPQDFGAVPTIDELVSHPPHPYLHHNELLRVKAAMASSPDIEAMSKASIDRWMKEFRGHIWQPTIQSYQTEQSRARMRLIDHMGLSYGKGGRKSSSAQCVLKPGTGAMFCNGRPYTEYFSSTEHRSQLGMPFYITGTVSQFDVFLTIKGGGITGQADAAKLAIANALQNFEPQFRPTMKVNKLLKRDSRSVERKHVGHKKARKSFTWVKR